MRAIPALVGTGRSATCDWLGSFGKMWSGEIERAGAAALLRAALLMPIRSPLALIPATTS